MNGLNVFLGISHPLLIVLACQASPTDPPAEQKATPPPRTDTPAERKATEPVRTDPPAERKATEAVHPLELDREHRYLWILERKKMGETVVRLSEVTTPEGKLYRSASRYRHEREGTSQSGEHDVYFDRRWRPVRFEAHLRFSGLLEYRSRQDQQGYREAGKLILITTHNQEKDSAVRAEMDAPPDCYLLLSQAVDHWAILAGEVLRRPATYDVKVLYPTLAKVATLRFLFEREEPVELGSGLKPACRLYSFRALEGGLEGKIWVDSRGRMLQYEQGTLRVLLDA